jgi:alginate production protein
LTHAFGFALRPSVTVAYAFGSGDGNPDDRVDRRFRQTGLQENEARFNGVTRVKYYGELLDPELSNLLIFTGGIGIRPTRRSSIDLVYHYYLQDKVSTSIRGAELDADPSGISKRLGSEIDLVVGYEELRDIDLKWVLGYFIPSKAFPKADGSLFVNFEVEWEF